MKNIGVGQTIAILANLGVIGGLVFVGLQLRQEQQIARQQMVHSSANLYAYWADLLNGSGDVWAKGLTGDSLSTSEAEQFSALAEAWHQRYFGAWFSVNEIGSGRGTGFAREEALKISENPGLREWWRMFRNLQSKTGRGGAYDEIVEEAMKQFSSRETTD